MENLTNNISIPYQPKIGLILLVFLMFGSCSALFIHLGINNDRGLILNHVIEFSVSGASYFYWALASASMGFVLIAILVLFRGMTSKRQIVISADTISAPKSGISSKIIRVKLSDIKSLEVKKVQSSRFLYIHHPDGKLTILNNMIPGKTGFDDLVALLTARVTIYRQSISYFKVNNT